MLFETAPGGYLAVVINYYHQITGLSAILLLEIVPDVVFVRDT
jgi:hypothetical protein